MTENNTHKGVILKQAREAQGIALDTVHEATKIPLDALRAIEEGYTVRTLSPFYYRGFLKMYAQYLGVDIKEVVEDFQPEVIPEPVKIEPQYEQWVAKFKKYMTPQMKRQLLKVAVVIVALVVFGKVLFAIKRFISHRKKKVYVARLKDTKNVTVRGKTKKESSREAIDKDKIVHTAASTIQEKMPVAQTSTDKEASSQQSEQPVSLTVRAKKNSWLRIKVDGTVVFQSTLKQGIAETWKAKKEIELIGRNIHLLEFEVNGKLIGLLGRADRGARKILVTKDGLSVKK